MEFFSQYMTLNMPNTTLLENDFTVQEQTDQLKEGEKNYHTEDEYSL